MSLDAPSLYGFATLLLALASFMSRLSLNGTKMAAKQHQTHFLPIQQSPTKKLLPANNPGWKPWLSLSCVSLMQTVTVEGLDSITSKTLRSEGVGSERDWLQRETWCLTSRGNTGQTRQIEHRCPLRLANRMCQRAAFIFSALLSLAEKIGREWMDREQMISTYFTSTHTLTGPPEEMIWEPRPNAWHRTSLISSSAIFRVCGLQGSSLRIIHFSAWGDDMNHVSVSTYPGCYLIEVCSGSYWDSKILSVCTVLNRNTIINTRNGKELKGKKKHIKVTYIPGLP